ncbi:MAG: D-alanyl-D-alanine carboxypeptidase [Lachnospiraceae bacterium]|nr:D-alanyl-D-alanine carboxypeptidase [Lachnospiraceae bacterium]
MKKKLRAMILFLAFAIFTNTIAFGATKPVVKAESAILVEASTGKILYEKNAQKTMYPASMTKILTSIIALDYLKPDDVVIVGNEINDVTLDSSKAGHIKGESITVENLIRGLIIPSGNDTATVVANAVAKKQSGDNNLSSRESERIFAELMNKKAKELGCTNSNFVNPHGYHDERHYTTAEDMAKIAEAALKIDLLKGICSEKEYLGNSMGNADITGLKTQNYDWKSHNLLITSGQYAYPYATGMKTGFTDEAGNCVTATAQKDGISLIAVIFNSEDPGRWEDAAKLFDYGFENFSFYTLAQNSTSVGEIGLYNNKESEGNALKLIIKEDISLLLEKTQVGAVKTDIKITNNEYIYKSKDESDADIKIKAPIEKDTELGTVTYSLNGETLAETKVYAEKSVEKATLIEKIIYTAKKIISKVFSINGLITVAAGVVGIGALVFVVKFLSSRTRSSKSKYKFKTNKRRGGRRF